MRKFGVVFFFGVLGALVLFLQSPQESEEKNVVVSEVTENKGWPKEEVVVIPAQAGIQGRQATEETWIPSQAGNDSTTSVDVAYEDDVLVFVTRVVDGDTIEIESGEKVRYIGVNTPESVDPRKAVQCFGKEASAYNKLLVEGKRVRLEADVEDRDRYGRLLRYVWIGDTMINEKLVQDGYAQLMTFPPNVKYVDRFKTAQTEAREAKRGLWSECK